MSDKMTNDELIDILSEAQEKMREAIDLIDTYVNETDDRNASAYLLDKLKIMTSDEHGYLSRDLNLDMLIGRLAGDSR